MASIQDKREIIHRHEVAFAETLSAEVIERPKLSVWMILIPILFVTYFYQLRRYAAGRRSLRNTIL
jgi:hypothetical protein